MSSLVDPAAQPQSLTPDSGDLLSMSLLNLGGPGWISDIFTCSVHLSNTVTITDRGSKFSVPYNTYTGHSQMYNSSSIVTGTIKITGPKGYKVWAGGVKVKIDEFVVLADPFVSNDLMRVERDLSEGMYVEGVVELPFELDLSKVVSLAASTDTAEQKSETAPLRFSDDFVGDLFALKHTLVVEIARPWWTFNVLSYTPISIFNVDHPAPPKGKGRRVLSESEKEEAIQVELTSQYAAGALSANDTDDTAEVRYRNNWHTEHVKEMSTLNHVMTLTDLPCTDCTFDYATDSFNMDSKIKGILNCRDVGIRIKEVELTLFKVESVDGNVVESVVKAASLMGEGKGPNFEFEVIEFDLKTIDVVNDANKNKNSKRKKEEVGEDGDDDDSDSDDENSDTDDLGPMKICPTISRTPSGTVSVGKSNFYEVQLFFRLTFVGEDDVRYWDTNEVYIHRKELPSAVVLEGEEGVSAV